MRADSNNKSGGREVRTGRSGKPLAGRPETRTSYSGYDAGQPGAGGVNPVQPDYTDNTPDGYSDGGESVSSGKKSGGRTGIIIIMCIAVVALIACGIVILKDRNKPEPQPEPPVVDPQPIVVKVTSVKLASSSYSLNVGGSVTLEPQLIPTNATNKDVTFSVTDDTIASVDTAGVVTGKKPGSTTVIVTSADGPNVNAVINVIETAKIMMPQESYSWNKSTKASSTATWTCTPIIDESCSSWKLSFKSSDENVATVTSKGKVTLKNLGEATLTATITSGKTSYSAEMMLYVNGITLSIEGIRSHEGAGIAEGLYYYFGCTCEDNGKVNQVAYTGTISKWLDGELTTLPIDDINAPVLYVSGGSEYFDAAGNGHLTIKNTFVNGDSKKKIAAITELKKWTVTLACEGDMMLSVINDGGNSIECYLEPVFTAASGAANVLSLDRMFDDEFNVFVAANKAVTRVTMNMNPGDATTTDPSVTTNVKDVKASGNQILFTPLTASGSPLAQDVIAVSKGGQMVRFHIIDGDSRGYFDFSTPNGNDPRTIAVGETSSVAITKYSNFSALEEAAAGQLKITYKSDDSSVASVSSDGTVTGVKPGRTTVTTTVSIPGKTMAVLQIVQVEGLELTMEDKKTIHYGDASEEGTGIPYTVKLITWDGSSKNTEDVTAHATLEHNGTPPTLGLRLQDGKRCVFVSNPSITDHVEMHPNFKYVNGKTYTTEMRVVYVN